MQIIFGKGFKKFLDWATGIILAIVYVGLIYGVLFQAECQRRKMDEEIMKHRPTINTNRPRRLKYCDREGRFNPPGNNTCHYCNGPLRWATEADWGMD